MRPRSRAGRERKAAAAAAYSGENAKAKSAKTLSSNTLIIVPPSSNNETTKRPNRKRAVTNDRNAEEPKTKVSSKTKRTTTATATATADAATKKKKPKENQKRKRQMAKRKAQDERNDEPSLMRDEPARKRRKVDRSDDGLSNNNIRATSKKSKNRISRTKIWRQTHGRMTSQREGGLWNKDSRLEYYHQHYHHRHHEFSSVLSWKCYEHVPLASEEFMIKVLVENRKKERGMIKDHPPSRLGKIQAELEKAPGLRLDQALSLRRQHIQLLNRGRPMTFLRLGREADVQKSAEIFERVVETFLKEQNIAFMNEVEQAAKFPQNQFTPDFLLPIPIQLKTWRDSKEQILEERTIHWIEVKMFYGASTIPTNSKGAVGKVVPKISKYVDTFGEGAIIFMQGCGEQMATQLTSIGVTVLCGADIPDHLMKRVTDHQRSWCANKDGIILP